MNTTELTQEEYIELFMKVKDRKIRASMKQLAFSALYSGNPSAKIYLPAALVEKLRANP